MMRRRSRAFTLVEMCVAMAVMAIVMSLAALEFKDVVYAHLFAESHLSVEQQARVAVAKIAAASRQASIVDSTPIPGQPDQNPSPAISEPQKTPGPRLVFTQVATLDTKYIDVNGAPQLCYNLVQIYLDKPSAQDEGKIWEQVAPNDPTQGNCPGYTYPAGPILLTKNVNAFSVEPLSAGKDKYEIGYRIDITIFDYEGYALDNRNTALYQLSTVILPNVYGKAQ